MTEQSKEFLKQKGHVDKLEAKLLIEQKKLQKLCNHHFPQSNTLVNCVYCGMSTYDP